MNAPSARPALAQAPADIDLLRTFLAIADTGYVLESGPIVTEGRASALIAMPDIRERILGL